MNRRWGSSENQTAAFDHREALRLQAEGKLREAESLATAALRSKERNREVDLETAAIVNTLAAIRLDRGEARQARADAIGALEILAELGAPGEDRQLERERVRALCLIGRSDMQLGQFDQARPMLERALTIASYCLESDSEEKVRVLRLLGTLCRESGHVHEAEEYYRKALALAERVFDPYHGEVAAVCHEMALLAPFHDEPCTLLAEARRGYEIRCSMFGSTHPLTAAAQAAWAAALEASGRLREAADAYVHALAIFDRQYAEHQCEAAILPETLQDWVRCLRGATRHLTHNGRGPEAREFAERALPVIEDVLGKSHPLTQSCRRLRDEISRIAPRARRKMLLNVWEWWRNPSWSSR